MKRGMLAAVALGVMAASAAPSPAAAYEAGRCLVQRTGQLQSARQ